MAHEERRDAMQRVRVGLTGLAVVLVLLAVATAIFRTVDQQAPVNRTAEAIENQAKANDEPLADLGMAPKTVEQNAAQTGQDQK